MTKLRRMLLLAILPVANARAEPRCGAGGRPWVAVDVDPAITEDVSRALVAQLAADLAERRIDVCVRSAPDAAPAIAAVHVTGRGATVGVDVEIRDALTNKRVARELDLSSLPKDGRGLAMAITAGELLRASWAELALRSAPPPPTPPPPEVIEIVRLELPRPAEQPARTYVGVVAAGELATGGERQLGIDARLRLDVGDHAGLSARFGLRQIVPMEAPDGRVSGSAIVAGLGVFAPLWATSSWNVAPAIRLDAMRLSYVGEPTLGRASNGAALGAALSGGVLGWVSLGGRLRVSADVLAGPVVIPVRVADGPRVVGGVSGVLLAACVGVGGAF